MPPSRRWSGGLGEAIGDELCLYLRLYLVYMCDKRWSQYETDMDGQSMRHCATCPPQYSVSSVLDQDTIRHARGSTPRHFAAARLRDHHSANGQETIDVFTIIKQTHITKGSRRKKLLLTIDYCLVSPTLCGPGSTNPPTPQTECVRSRRPTTHFSSPSPFLTSPCSADDHHVFQAFSFPPSIGSTRTSKSKPSSPSYAAVQSQSQCNASVQVSSDFSQ